MPQGQDYNMIMRISNPTMQYAKFQQEQITTKWQCLNTKLPAKHEINKFPNKEIQKMSSPWSPFWSVEHGSWGLGGALLPHSIQGMDDIFPIKSKKEWPIGRCYCQCKKKNGGLEMGFKKWVCSKDGQEHKNLKRYWERWMKASLEA